MRRRLARPFQIAAYHFSWAVFIALVLPLQIASLLLLPWAHTAAVPRFVARMLHGHCRLLLSYLRLVRILDVRSVNLQALDHRRGLILIANHPSLIDALLVFALIPGVICVYKSSLRRSLLFSAIPRAAGFIPNDEGLGLIRAASAAARHRRLLIFPEGTRTVAGTILNPLKPGFALAARRAGVPIQLVFIRTSSGLLGPGHKWGIPPELPARFEIVIDSPLPPDLAQSTAALARQVEDRLRAGLALTPVS